MKIYNLKNTKEKRRLLRQKPTDAETLLWKSLRNKGLQNIKFFRQYGIGHYIADFYCPKVRIAVEVDGDQHLSKDGMMYDKERERFFSALNITTLGFSNRDVLANTESVVDRIRSEIVHLASPSLIKEGELGS